MSRVCVFNNHHCSGDPSKTIQYYNNANPLHIPVVWKMLYKLFLIDYICLLSLAQDDDCMGTPVKVQKTDTTTEPEIA